MDNNETKRMTWREVRKAIEAMSDAEQDAEAKVFVYDVWDDNGTEYHAITDVRRDLCGTGALPFIEVATEGEGL